MKIRILLLICILLSACGKAKHGGKSELTALYEELDAEIDKSSEYENIKESRMARLRKAYDMTNDSRQRTDIINRIIAEFDAYNADSALYYVSYNLHRPDVKTIPGEYTRLMIKRADIFAHAGLFADALAIMQNIPRDSLTPSLLEAYYSTYCATYQYLSEYTDEHETALEYAHHRTLYSDSLNRVISPDSFNHLVYVLSQKAREGNTQEAIEALSQHLSDYLSGTREYSILASTLAYIYKTAGYKDEYKRHLVLSAISDVRGAVKENLSFREVATVMFEDGDVERANRYLKKSIADANFYSAMMRNAQSSKMLPVIDEAYTSMQNRLTGRLRIMVWISSILSVFLILTLVFLLRQYKSLHKANERVSLANEELSAMSQLLRETNAELEHRNNELHEYNRTKEQYAGLFMEYCSTAISTLQHYQQSLRVLAAQGGNRAALMKKLESSETGDGLLRNFYGRFDEAILNIYPSFVDKFNTLLKPEERVVLKSGELLNTELRLFALIRIGIDDSNQIAQFLRCSISTVYTYRSKMKKRALNPSDFESEVRNIT